MCATQFIHAAWQLNFKLRLEGFKRVHVAGVRHLIDIALASPRPQSPSFVFLSSVAVVGKTLGLAPVLEESLPNEALPALGYGFSKLVGERICELAVERAGLKATIVRIGQIS